MAFLFQHVVCEALKCVEARAGNFTLTPKDETLPKWPRRGLPEDMDSPGMSNVSQILGLKFNLIRQKLADASSVIRCSPDHDATNGFFVACFVKMKSDLHLSRKRLDREDDEPRSSKTRKRKKRNKLLTRAGS